MNVIDALVVTLGLDNRDFKKGQAETEDALKKTREGGKSTADSLEANGKRAAAFFTSLRNEVAGLLLTFAGAKGLKDFASSIIAGDAATGRLAGNLGIATEQLSAWEGAITRVGGKAEDADAALQAMVTAQQNLKLTGSTGHDPDFQRFGIVQKDLEDPANALLKMADAGERMGKPEFVARLQRIGIPESTINMLEKGRVGVQQLLVEQEKLGVTTDKNAESAQQFQDAIARLQLAIKGEARPEIEGLANDFSDLASDKEGLHAFFQVVGGGMHIFAETTHYALNGLRNFLVMMRELKNGDVSGALHTAWASITGHLGWGQNGSGWTSAPGSDWTPATGVDQSAFPGMASQRPTGARGAPAGGGMGAITSYLAAHGLSQEQANGVAGWVMAESGGNPNAFNATGGGQGAHGIGQWRGPRLRRLRERYGANPTLGQQLEFLVWELHGGDPGGASVRGASGTNAALWAAINKFGRPDRPGSTVASRLEYARALRFYGTPPALAHTASHGPSKPGNTTNNVGPITVNTAATNAHGIARDLGGALRRRGLVVQAQSGMTP